MKLSIFLHVWLENAYSRRKIGFLGMSPPKWGAISTKLSLVQQICEKIVGLVVKAPKLAQIMLNIHELI